jgi:hypothetical protein
MIPMTTVACDEAPPQRSCASSMRWKNTTTCRRSTHNAEIDDEVMAKLI